MVFDFIQFWLDGRPGNEYFWISHKISDLLTPLRPLDLYPQCLLKMKSEIDWSNSSQCGIQNNLWSKRDFFEECCGRPIQKVQKKSFDALKQIKLHIVRPSNVSELSILQNHGKSRTRPSYEILLRKVYSSNQSKLLHNFFGSLIF